MRPAAVPLPLPPLPLLLEQAAALAHVRRWQLCCP